MTLTVLKHTGQVFCRLSLNFGFSDVFLMFRLELWRLDRKHNQVPLFITSYKEHMLSTRLTTDVTMDCFAEVAFVSFLHCKVILFPPSILFCLLFERKSLCTAHAQRVGLLLAGAGGTFLHQCFDSSLWEICLFSLINLLVQSFIYIIMGSWILTDTLCYGPKPCYCLCCSNCPFGHWEIFQLAPCVLLTYSHQCGFGFVFSFVWELPYFLELQDAPNSFCIFRALSRLIL